MPSRELDKLDDYIFSLDPLSKSNSRDFEELDNFLLRLKSESDDISIESEDLEDYLLRIKHSADAINPQSNDPLSANEVDLFEYLFEPSVEESIEYTHDAKRRRISPESKGTTGLKSTGLDLLDAFNGKNAASTSTPKDNDDEPVKQTNDRGNAIIN